jgi:glycerol-3-phosphate cytidylyltransferase
MKEFKTVYIAGCWDYCHEGHVNILKKAKEFGDFLIVGVNSDSFIKSYKNISTTYNENERLNSIRALDFVDLAFILEDYDYQRTYIDIFKPSVIVHGNDWAGKSLYKQMNITEEQIKNYFIDFKYPDYTPGISSTILRNNENSSLL